MTASTAAVCASCGTQIAPSLLVCPSCKALIHSARIKQLAAEAERAEADNDLIGAVTRWRSALELLPSDSRQHDVVSRRVTALAHAIDRKPAVERATAPAGPWWKRSWALLAAVAIFALTKGKLLLLGLTKASTVFSMLAFMGVYWTIFGWKFALLFVLGIYIHEMGHVAELRRYGIEATAPMFIPGLGAYIRAKQHFTDVRQDARVGLAGPIWGLGAGLVAYGIGLFTGSGLWYAVAKTTGFLNLFNLIPFWQLDGGRAFHALNRGQRLVAAAVIGLAWWQFREGMLALLLILAVWQVFSNAPEEPDNGALGMYAALVLVLSWLSTIPVATPI